MTKKRRINQSGVRHARIYLIYLEKLKEYGDLAPRLSKSFIYEEVADLCGYSSEHVRKVVTCHIKKKT